MKLIQIITENKLDVAIEKYGSVIDLGVLNQLYSGDPSETKKYFNWMVDSYYKNHSFNPSSIVNAVEDFEVNIDKFTPENLTGMDGVSDKILRSPKDINNYIVPELIKIVNQVKQIKSKREIKKEGAEVIYEDSRWLILVPLTQEASCYYGSGTKWCTAAREGNRFEQYTRDGYLIYFLDKTREDGRFYKMALLFKIYGTTQISYDWYDEQDKDFDGGMIELLPIDAVSAMKSYINKKISEIQDVKIFSYNQINTMVISKLIKTDLKTPYGKLHPFYNPIHQQLTWTATKEMLNNFPDVKSLSILVTPDVNDDNLFINYYLNDTINGQIDDEAVVKFRHSWPVQFLRSQRVKTDREIKDAIDTLVYEYTNVFLKNMLRFIEDYGLKTDIKLWEPDSYKSTMKFNYPPKKNSLTDLFINYVIRRQRRNLPATKRDFYKTVLGYKTNAENSGVKLPQIVVNPTTGNSISLGGHNSQFFAGITQSGILQRDGQFYKLGPNYDLWTKGLLKR